MQQTKRILLGIAVAVALVIGANPAVAQTVTTGTLTGVVMDAQKAVLPGATVVAVHVPTGSTYEAVTQADGRFTMLAVRVGGPYKVTATMSGFKTFEQDGVIVALGESRSVDFSLELETVKETVTVVATSQLIDTARAGTADSVASETLNALPSVSRNLFDFARTSPHFNATASNDGDTFISVAGQNNRYNNVQIDGAVNNDLFGLSASGTPGGQAGTQPVSLDAIAELQLLVSPYDVRQGTFAGGGVNAVTKSGTNAFRGTGYFYFRNQDWVGEGPTETPIATFSDKQYGGSVGGPLAKNKAFFFTNLDYGRRSTPTGYSANGSSGQNFGRTAEVQAVYDTLKNVYKYDPAPGANPLDEFIRDINNNKFFLRSDINISNRHRLTARYNYVDANQWVGNSSTTSYKFWDNYYNFISETNSFVGQLNSTFGQSFNEFRVTYQRIRDHREFPEAKFPQVTVRLSDGVGRVVAGAEQFSLANELDQDIVEVNDDFTVVRGTHTFTLGTHNEFFKFRNLFIRDNAGTYEFSSVANLAAGIAGGYDYSFSTTGDPQQAAKFRIQQWGFYAGDQWRVKPSFTLTYGVRWDGPNFPDTPTANPAAEAVFGYGTDVVPSPASWSPRAGFNWELPGESRQQIRGGIGLFSGRTPYVWLSNQYGNTGIEFRRLRVTYSSSNNVTFIPDPNNQPTSIGSAATNEVDMVDPDYKFPQLIRGNLAYDRQLPWGMRGTFEYLFSTVVNDIKYQNLNMLLAGTRPDGRPFYGRVNTAYSDVIFLTNTGEGSTWSVSAKVDKPWSNGWFASGSYIYGRAKSVMDGTSSQAASNWGNVYNPGDMNNPPLATSNFDVRHRITLQASYDFRIYRELKATASVYYNGQSGRPYVDLFSGDVNGDGRTTNDILYIPRDANDVVVYNGTYDTLDTYLRASGLDAYRGQIVERNLLRSPWVNSMDVKFNFQVPTGKRVKTEITFDILNFINLFGNTNGEVMYANFNDLLPLGYGGLDTATGKMRYNVQNLTNLQNAGREVSPNSLFTRDDLRSRWQAQLGLRVRF